MNPKVIHIKATINRGIADVWNYYTDHAYCRVEFCTADWCPKATNELSVGGKYLHEWRPKTEVSVLKSQYYNEIVPHKKLSYALED